MRGSGPWDEKVKWGMKDTRTVDSNWGGRLGEMQRVGCGCNLAMLIMASYGVRVRGKGQGDEGKRKGSGRRKEEREKEEGKGKRKAKRKGTRKGRKEDLLGQVFGAAAYELMG